MYKTLQDFVGNTPLVRLLRIHGADNERRGNVILAKLEGGSRSGSVMDTAPVATAPVIPAAPAGGMPAMPRSSLPITTRNGVFR